MIHAGVSQVCGPWDTSKTTHRNWTGSSPKLPIQTCASPGSTARVGQLALVNLALPPVRAHVLLLFMKKLEADAELRVYVYDVQNH